MTSTPSHIRLGRKLLAARTATGRTQRETAILAGISVVYLNRVEHGWHEPSRAVMRRLAKVLRVPVTTLEAML